MVSVLAAAVVTAADWGELTRRGEWLFASGELEEAEAAFEAALTVAEAGGSARQLETSLDNLARLLQHRQRFAEARPLLERLLELERSRLGAGSPAQVATLNALGNSARAVGDRDGAVRAFERSVAIAEANANVVDPERYRFALTGLAVSLAGGEAPGSAIPVYRKLLAEQAEAFGPEDREAMATLESLANLEMRHGSGETAETLFRTLFEWQLESAGREAAALALADSAASMLGSGHVEAAERMATTAVETFQEGGLLEAVATLARASWLEVRIAAPSVIVVLDAASGPSAELEAALKRHRQLAELEREQLGPASPQLAGTLKRIAMLEARSGDIDATVEAQRRLVAVQRAAGSGQVAESLGVLAALEQRAGEPEAALASNTEHIELLEDRLGEHAVELLGALERQVELLKRLDRKREARPYKKQLRKVKRELRRRS
jgi:tetratricopeptide (TPR) repeat protein